MLNLKGRRRRRIGRRKLSLYAISCYMGKEKEETSVKKRQHFNA